MADSLRVLIADDESLHNLALTSQLEMLAMNLKNLKKFGDGVPTPKLREMN